MRRPRTPSLRRLAASALLAPLLIAFPRPALGHMDVDPRMPMAWGEMLACRLVVVARYEGHEGTSALGLRVVEVVRGERVAPDDVLSVALEHRYSLQTGPEGCAYWGREDDGVPKLCYETQFDNPGPLCPARIVPDVREPALYFFPDDSAPALAVRNQVQPMRFAAGWRQALAGARPDLAFRLLQRVDERITRDALEELYVTRDQATLAELVGLLRDARAADELGVPELLVAVGDRGGDVYDPLLAQFLADRDGPEDRRPYTAARILAQVDRERAVRDLSRAIAAAPPELKHVAAASVGWAGTESALELALGLLGDPTFADDALSSLGVLLGANNDWYRFAPAPTPGADRARLKQIAKPRIAAAVAHSYASEDAKRNAGYALRELLDQPASVDLPRAEKLLLDPDGPAYRGVSPNDAEPVLDAFRRASDPACVPLLVKILKTVPATREGNAYGFTDVLLHYARTCRREMRRELERQGVYDLMQLRAPDRHDLASVLPGALGEAYGDNDFGNVADWGLLDDTVRRRATPELAATLTRRIEADLAGEYGPSPRDLRFLLAIDPAAGAPLLERALRRPKAEDKHAFAEILALGVKAGHETRAAELIAAVRATFEADKPANGYLASPLLEAGRGAPYAEYLKLLDGARPTLLSDPGDLTLRGGAEYQGMLRSLFASHPADFFDRVASLLDSKELRERAAGEQLLDDTLYWNFGFASQALAPVRAAKIGYVRAALRALGAMKVPEMRAYVLRERGVALAGAPGKAWVPALAEAAAGFDPATARNALDLLEVVVGDDGCAELWPMPPDERGRAVRAFLADRAAREPRRLGGV